MEIGKLTKEDIIRFENRFLKLKGKSCEINDEIERYILNQMTLFHAGSISIKDIKLKDENLNIISTKEDLDSRLLFRIISGSVLRQIFESLIRVMYIQSGGTKEEQIKRFENIISNLGREYKNLISSSNDKDFVPDESLRQTYANGLSNLPEGKELKKINIWEMLKQTSLGHIYPIYKTACFYAHGTIDDVSWEKLFGKKGEKMPALSVFLMLYLCANIYNDIMKKIWGERYPEIFI